MSFLTPLIFGAGFVFLKLEVFVEFGGITRVTEKNAHDSIKQPEQSRPGCFY